jgi:hypothetical protein
MQPLNPGLVNQNFADSSPAADVIDAFHQAPDLGIDAAWKIAAFSLKLFSTLQKFAIQFIRCRPHAF